MIIIMIKSFFILFATNIYIYMYVCIYIYIFFFFFCYIYSTTHTQYIWLDEVRREGKRAKKNNKKNATYTYQHSFFRHYYLQILLSPESVVSHNNLLNLQPQRQIINLTSFLSIILRFPSKWQGNKKIHCLPMKVTRDCLASLC